ncbi:MAG TPA: hypothetical protein VGS03_18785 [Candidatus Polarisedimenticolia bacterium]|jgi:hypothetical protein|nr:hypothetical protein [Candidatus Polarisedimenticolia bacterium]
MPARRTTRLALLAVALLVVMAAGVATAPAASKIAADPNELYERASAKLQKGDLPGASTDAARLFDLVRAHPQWDPDGAYAQTLLPPLQARIRRLKAASATLDQWSEKALAELKPPDLKSRISTVKDYTHWATSVVERLRADRTAVVAASLASPEERALLKRTPAWARSERLFDNDVLKGMADKTSDDILGLLSGDLRLETVLTRFRQLKRDLMEAIAERDALQEKLDRLGAPREPEAGTAWIPWTLAALLGGGCGVLARLVRDRGRRLAVMESRLSGCGTRDRDRSLPGSGDEHATRRAA